MCNRLTGIDEPEDVVEHIIATGFWEKLEHLCVAHGLLFFIDLLIGQSDRASMRLAMVNIPTMRQ